MASMYHQIRLHESITHLFGFAVPNFSGSYDYYRYLKLPFGASPAVHLVTMLINPIKQFLHSLSLDFSISIDDGIHIARVLFRALIGIRFIIFIFRFAGWKIQWSKCQLIPANSIHYLGYELNSVDMIIKLPESKLQKIYIYIDQLQEIYANKQLVAARFFAQYCGKLAHCLLTHGSIISFCTRFAHHSLGLCIVEKGWDSSMALNDNVMTEIQLIRRYLSVTNGRPIYTAQASYSVLHQNQIENILLQIDPDDAQKNFHIFVSDSSDFKTFSYRAGKLDMVNEYYFTPLEADLSSGYRELLAVYHSFQTHKNFFRNCKGQVIIWVTDSQVLYSWLLKGARIPFVQRLLIQIKVLEFETQIKLNPKWERRSHNLLKLADAGSKLELSASEYGLDHANYEMLKQFFNTQFDIDGFASKLNKRTHHYISLLPDNAAIDINFLYHQIDDTVTYYLHPPISCIRWTLSKLVSAPNVSAVLVLPIWPAASYWPFLLDGEFFAWFISEYVIFRPCYAYFSQNAMFKGYRSFPTLAIFVRTRNFHKIPLPNFSAC